MAVGLALHGCGDGSREPLRHGVSILLELQDAHVSTSLEREALARPESWERLLDEDLDRPEAAREWTLHAGAGVAALLGGGPGGGGEDRWPPRAAGLPVPSHAAALRFVPLPAGRTSRVEVDVGGGGEPLAVSVVEFLRPADAALLRDVAKLRDLFAASHVQNVALEEEAGGPAPGVRRWSTLFVPRRDSESALLCVVTGAQPAAVRAVRASAAPAALSRLGQTQPASYPSTFVKRVDFAGDHRPAAILRTPAVIDFPLPGRMREPLLDLAAGALEADAALGLTVTFVGSDGEEEVVRAELSALANAWREHRFGPSTLPAVERVRIAVDAARGPVDFALASPFLAPAEAATTPGGAPRDVVLISLDTMRADRMSPAAGTTNAHWAALAAKSAVFANAMSAASYTLPSHVTIFSGQYPDRHGVTAATHAVNARHVPMLALEFARAGYRTAAFTGGGYVHPDFGFAIGFQRYDVRDLAEDVRQARFPRPGAGTPRLDALRERLQDRSAPLFLFVHTYAAHNYAAPEPDLAACGVTPAELAPLAEELGATGIFEGLQKLGGTPERRDLLRRLYDAAARSADALLGQVLAELERAGRLERALVVVLSDHGEELYERGRLGHGNSVHEEIVHVPLLFHGAGVRPGTVDEPVTLADVAPTLRELCGLPALPEATDGVSVAPSLLAGVAPPSRPLLARSRVDNRFRVRAYRAGPWKLIAPEGRGEPTLFHLPSDPGERADVSSTNDEVARRARLELERRVLALKSRQQQGESSNLSRSTTEDLQALGYLGG